MKKRTLEYTSEIYVLSTANPNILHATSVVTGPVTRISPVMVTFCNSPLEEARGATYTVSQVVFKSTSKLRTKLLNPPPFYNYNKVY